MLSKKKYFGVVVQFYDESICNLRSYLHSFQESSEKSDAKALYDILASQILDRTIGKNVIGISMDNASINKRTKKSISTFIVHQYPYVWINFCLCHSCNLVCKYAAKVIPAEVEKLMIISQSLHQDRQSGSNFKRI